MISIFEAISDDLYPKMQVLYYISKTLRTSGGDSHFDGGPKIQAFSWSKVCNIYPRMHDLNNFVKFQSA